MEKSEKFFSGEGDGTVPVAEGKVVEEGVALGVVEEEV
jgi:hypothetical protein